MTTNPFDLITARLDAIAVDVRALKSAASCKPQPRRYDMDVPKVAARLGLAKQTIRKNCHLRRMPFAKRNGRLFFDEREIEAWLSAGRRPTAAEAAEERMSGNE